MQIKQFITIITITTTTTTTTTATTTTYNNSYYLHYLQTSPLYLYSQKALLSLRFDLSTLLGENE